MTIFASYAKNHSLSTDAKHHTLDDVVFDFV